MRIGVVHGPNLNLLGRREPEIYGRQTLEEINSGLSSLAAELGVEVEFYQSNGEGELIDYVQDAGSRVAGFIVNGGGYSHTSIALLDALAGVGRPYIEVHLSNLAAREPYRHRSLLAGKARGIVMGFGVDSYSLAFRGLVGHLRAVPGEGATARSGT